MIDKHYQPIYRQAAAAQNAFHTYTHTMANDPNARIIRNQIHHLTNDLAGNKNPRVIEQRMRTIQNQIQRTQMLHPTTGQPQSAFLNARQSQQLHQNFEAMRRSITQHPHF